MSNTEAEIFKNFVAELKGLTGLEAKEIEKALDVYEGLSGVLKYGCFILAYEQLGWLVSRELNIEKIRAFGFTNASFLTQDEGAMYFFVQALMEKKDISNEDLLDLISAMPKQYQKYLLVRFGFSPIPSS